MARHRGPAHSTGAVRGHEGGWAACRSPCLRAAEEYLAGRRALLERRMGEINAKAAAGRAGGRPDQQATR